MNSSNQVTSYRVQKRGVFRLNQVSVKPSSDNRGSPVSLLLNKLHFLFLLWENNAGNSRIFLVSEILIYNLKFN
jgi:hypothetical protein